MNKLFLACLALLTLTVFSSYAQTNVWTNGNNTGIWSEDGNWSLGVAPDGTGPVEFNTTTGSNADCKIDVDAGGIGVGQGLSTTLTILSNYTGTITFDAGVTYQGTTFSIAAGTFDASNAGDLIFSTYSQSGGTFTSTTGNLFLSGSITKTSGTFNPNSGIVYVSTNATVAIPNGFIFDNLTLGRSSTGTSIINVGTTTAHSITVQGNLVIANSIAALSIRINNGTINLQGDFDNSGNNGTNTTASTGAINLNGTGNQSIFGLAAGNTAGYTPSITINKSSGSLTLTDFITINGNLTVTSFSGTPTVTGSTITMIGASRTVDGKGASTLPFNNFSIGRSAASSTVTMSDDLKANGSFTINNSGSTFSTGGFGLELGGSFTNSATFTPGASVITLSGGNTQSIDFRNTTDITINTLVVNKSGNTATISDAIIISDLLTSTAGALNVGSGLVTLQSNSTKTAEVGTVSGSITGSFIIQRYIPVTGSSKWRFLAAPITSGSSLTLRNGWQSQIFVTGNGTGTGPVGTANYNSNGYDWTSSGNPSMYTYNENQNIDFNSRWTAIGSPTSTNLISGTGYRVFVRGDRSDANRLLGSVSQNAVTMSITGNIQTGTQTLNTTCSNGCGTDDGWNMLGNPFPATVNWDNIGRSSVDATVYVFSPSLNAYSTYTASGSGTNGGEKYIHSGQAFFVKCNSSSGGSIAIEEVDKLAGGSSGFFKTGDVTNELRVFLTNPAATVKDEIVVGYNENATKNFDGDYDAYKLGATAFGYISSHTTTSSTRLAVNKIKQQQSFTIDTVVLFVSLNATAKDYSLNFSGISTFTSGTSIYLYDKYLSTTVDVAATPIYNFATNTDSASFGERFYLYMGSNAPLSIQYKTFNAAQDGKNVLVTWTTSSETNNAGYEIQYSTDATNFTTIGNVQGTANSSVEESYSFTHSDPIVGMNYYRIKQTNTSGTVQYTSVAIVDFTIPTGVSNIASASKDFKIYPVPAKDFLTVQFGQEIKGDVKLTISDAFGNQVSSKIIPASAGNEIRENVSFLSHGVFFIELKTSNGVTKKAKFIKD